MPVFIKKGGGGHYIVWLEDNHKYMFMQWNACIHEFGSKYAFFSDMMHWD